MATFGGIFKVFNSQWSNPATPDTKYYDCKAWGIVIDAPEEKAKKKPPYSPYVIFWLKVRRKLNIECFVYQDDNPYAFAIARLLRPGDPVDISGNLREIMHTVTKGKKAGTERIERQMSVHTISPQRIVAALTELMSEQDYASITITEITQRAGVSRMTYYRNYSSKEDILRKFMEDVGERIHAKIMEQSIHKNA